MTPADFDPYRDQIRDCHCPMCRNVAYAASDVLDFDGRRHRAAAADLLTALRDGKHERVSLDARVAELREEKSRRLAEARGAGESEATIAAIERGYSTTSARDFYASGMGIGMTPRGSLRRRPPRGPWSVPRPDRGPAR